MSQYLIITTVGTSVFTNFNKEEVQKAFEERGRDYSPLNLTDRENESADEYDIDIFESLENIVKSKWLKGVQKKEKSNTFSLSEDNATPNSHASAEITSILKIAEKLRNQDEKAKFEVQLLATDTALSVSAAKLIKKYQWPDHITLREYKQADDFVKSLGVKPPTDGDPETFYDKGLQNLVEKLVDKQSGLIRKARQDGYEPVINFSGGYKAIIPFLTVIAQLENISMYYIYEDSDYLLEMGSLPVGWDWGTVEALKPLLKNYILGKNEFQQLADAFKQGKVRFSIERQMYIPKDGMEVDSGLYGIHVNFHLAFFNLWQHKLISGNVDPTSENLITITPLGRIMRSVNSDAEKGYVMEHLLFKYFSLEKKQCELTQPYQSTHFIEIYPRNFRIIDKSTVQLQLETNKDRNTREIGDIDLALSKVDGGTTVWAESKAFSAACDYSSVIGRSKDYLFQLKARGLAFYQARSKPSELLFLVFRFVIPGITDQEGFLESDHFKKVLTHLYKLNTDPDLSGKSSFRCIGISIPVGFKGAQLDLTDFYKGHFHRWVFEEIQLESGNIS
jgi:putative CRISPR-associated protein (TIGR02619 family)